MYVRAVSRDSLLWRVVSRDSLIFSRFARLCVTLGSTYTPYITVRTDPLGMTDRDEALHYLLNKLKSEDGWSSSNLTWNDEKLAVISDQFSSFDGVVKAKVLLSFLSMSPRTISKVRGEGYRYVDLLECGVPLNIYKHTIAIHVCTCTLYMYM